MGTNFYWTPEMRDLLGVDADVERDDPAVHIGKRSAAGLYCWDCGVTLCVGGPAKIHTGSGTLARCFCCGKKPERVEGWSGPAAVELGFAEPATEPRGGVRGCSSFTWAQDPATVRARVGEHPAEEMIEDEYGRRMTGDAFLRMLEANCPVQFTQSVGRWFS